MPWPRLRLRDGRLSGQSALNSVEPAVDNAESSQLIPSHPSSNIRVKCTASALFIASPLFQRISVRCRSNPVIVFSFEFGAPRRDMDIELQCRPSHNRSWRRPLFEAPSSVPWAWSAVAGAFFSLCARRARNSMSSAERRLQPHGRVAPLAYRL